MSDAVDLAEERLDAERALLGHALAHRLRPSGAVECEDCGCDIPAARRKAAPFATRCVACQEQSERMRL